MIENMDDFHALDPFFRTIEQGLAGHVDGEHFFDMLAQDVAFDFVITVPDYPRHVVGRDNLIELYRGYGKVLFLDRCYDLRTHHSPSTSTVVLEVLLRRQGRRHRSPLRQQIHLRGRHQGPQSHRVARLPGPTTRLRRPRGTPLRARHLRSNRSMSCLPGTR